MKTLKFYLIFAFAFALLFIQCKEAVLSSRITVTVKNYNTENAIQGVKIIGPNTVINTNQDGNATLNGVTSGNNYIFSKKDFLTQTIQFENSNSLNKLNIYLKPDVGAIVRGTIYNEDDQTVEGVTVSDGNNNTTSDRYGDYSLQTNQNRGEAFTISYNKDGTDGILKMKVDQDTVIVDVFIDGFTTMDSDIDKK